MAIEIKGGSNDINLNSGNTRRMQRVKLNWGAGMLQPRLKRRSPSASSSRGKTNLNPPIFFACCHPHLIPPRSSTVRFPLHHAPHAATPAHPRSIGSSPSSHAAQPSQNRSRRLPRSIPRHPHRSTKPPSSLHLHPSALGRSRLPSLRSTTGIPSPSTHRSSIPSSPTAAAAADVESARWCASTAAVADGWAARDAMRQLGPHLCWRLLHAAQVGDQVESSVRRHGVVSPSRRPKPPSWRPTGVQRVPFPKERKEKAVGGGLGRIEF
uniref:Uncharacterized protein n=1 Tax=Setaria viridis TaxID=4556 RepID=A0A4U6VU36_SETVI|nr:hypothetical protein SEVIR_2G229600v2 [Setaria viridis]TKW33368.1 hypothetical protein SEVIR_2G229600v2 [Setaria viridis]TKW33369.1 hypothetical protein SEVIR_2G229600v2 [Setaria viridis]